MLGAGTAPRLTGINAGVNPAPGRRRGTWGARGRAGANLHGLVPRCIQAQPGPVKAVRGDLAAVSPDQEPTP